MVTTLIHNAAVAEEVMKNYLQQSSIIIVGCLCGSCEDGYGVSALLNNCVTCHDASGTLIIILCKLNFILCIDEVTLHCINLIIPVSGDIKQALLTLLHL